MNVDDERQEPQDVRKYIIALAVVLAVTAIVVFKGPIKRIMGLTRAEKEVEVVVNMWREGKTEEVQNRLGEDAPNLADTEREIREVISHHEVPEEFVNQVVEMLRLVKAAPHSKEVKINSTTREVEMEVQYLDIDSVLTEIKIIESNSEYEKGTERYNDHLMEMLLKGTPIKTDIVGVKMENIAGKWIIVSNNLPRILLGGYEVKGDKTKPKTVEELDNLGTVDGVLNEVEQMMEADGHNDIEVFDYTEFSEYQKNIKIPDPNTPFEEWELNWIKTPDDSHLKETHIYDSPDSFIIEKNN